MILDALGVFLYFVGFGVCMNKLVKTIPEDMEEKHKSAAVWICVFKSLFWPITLGIMFGVEWSEKYTKKR
jgi:MFS superfamily sulfate permease-like transporter